jgi:hypothetical protein
MAAFDTVNITHSTSIVPACGADTLMRIPSYLIARRCAIGLMLIYNLAAQKGKN